MLDEFDKLCEVRTTSAGENISTEQQGELLAIIEGTKVQIILENELPPVEINTENITFVFCGCFDSIRKKKYETGSSMGFGGKLNEKESIDSIEISADDLIEYGVTPELAGRMSEIVLLNPFTEDDIYDILSGQNELINPLLKTENKYGVSLNLSEEEKREIAHNAIDKRMGIRWIYSVLQKRANKIIYENNGCEL